MLVTKKYFVATKKIMWHPKEDSRWLNMFSVAKGIHIYKEMVPAVCKYMLYWLKKFCVARKVVWCRTKIKDVVINVTNFCQNGVPCILV